MNDSLRPCILDASAVVDLLGGDMALGDLLSRADAGQVVLSLPALSVASAQVELGLAVEPWEVLFARPGLHEQPLTSHGALEAGRIAAPRLRYHPVQKALIGPLMVGQIVAEARATNGVIVTRIPEAYGAYDVHVRVF